MTRISPMVISVLLALGLAMVTTPAAAHNAVVDQQPGPESEVTESPVAIRITTSDQVLSLGEGTSANQIAVRDGAGQYYGDGCTAVGERWIETSVALGEPGVYTVVYQFVSADGHSLSDSYTFTYAPTADYDPALGTPQPPVCGGEPPAPGSNAEASESPVAQPDAEATPIVIAPASETEANPWLVGSGIALAVLAVALLALWLARRGR